MRPTKSLILVSWAAAWFGLSLGIFSYSWNPDVTKNTFWNAIHQLPLNYWHRSNSGFLLSSKEAMQTRLHAYNISSGIWELDYGWSLCWDSSNSGLEIKLDGKSVWATIPNRPFILVYSDEFHVSETYGSFKFFESIKIDDSVTQTISSIDRTFDSKERNGSSISIQGKIVSASSAINYLLSFYAETRSLIKFTILTTNERSPTSSNVVRLIFNAAHDEKIFGLGEQYSYIDLSGKLVPIVTREQGIGRGGIQPLSTFLNIFSGFSGGDQFTTYTFVPHFTTSRHRGMYLTNREFSWFDFRNISDGFASVSVKISSSKIITGGILSGYYSEMIDSFTSSVSGRMKPLPEWVNKGLILGVQGGEKRVTEKIKKMKDAGIALAAIWIQDWCGKREQKIAGQAQSRLWWNWEPDSQLYPNWRDFIQTISSNYNISVMAYINPYLSNVTLKSTNYTRNLFNEAIRKQFVLQRQGDHKKSYIQTSGPNFEFATIDLLNPEAVEWYQNIIKNNFIDAGVKGWMADFGESVPFDAVSPYFGLTGLDNDTYHNSYPELWAKLNREVVDRYDSQKNTFFFMRSGNMFSPKYCTCFWAGDQLTSFDSEDGLPSVLNAYLSSGLSGFAHTHSDIGGYTTVPFFKIPGIDVRRSKEVIIRWMELEVFSSVLRSHEGAVPQVNAQVYDDDVLEYVRGLAELFVSLRFYRRKLFDDAYKTGKALRLPIFVYFPEEPESLAITDAFMYGPKIFVAPVLTAGAMGRKLDYLPAGQWIHVWSGEIFTKSELGRWIDAPLGRPPIFVSKDEWETPGSNITPFKECIEGTVDKLNLVPDSLNK